MCTRVGSSGRAQAAIIKLYAPRFLGCLPRGGTVQGIGMYRFSGSMRGDELWPWSLKLNRMVLAG